MAGRGRHARALTLKHSLQQVQGVLLVVDDEQDALDLLKAVLEGKGARVTAATCHGPRPPAPASTSARPGASATATATCAARSTRAASTPRRSCRARPMRGTAR